MLVQATIGICLSLGVAVLSYQLFEKRFLELKDRFAPATPRPVPARPLPAAGEAAPVVAERARR